MGAFLILNLDDTLTRQERLLAFPHIRVDLTEVEGKKCCTTPETLAALEAALAPYKGVPLCFWGAGEYHYITYARLRTLRLPLTLVLFDHHHDCVPTQGGVITCGDWVSHALQLPWVQRVVWIGGEHPELWAFRPHPKLLRVTPATPPSQFAAWAAGAVPTGLVYVSIDKDVLPPADAITHWEGGDLPLQDLLAWLDGLLRHRRVIGVDVGGEWSLSPGQVVPSFQDLKAIRQNEKANLAILHLLRRAGLPGCPPQAAGKGA